MDGIEHFASGDASPLSGERELAALDRRGSDRYRTICRIARIGRAGDSGFWRVRNISNEGLMLAADTPTAVGERLEIALSDTVKLSGTILWIASGCCGVAFSETINAAAVLRHLSEEQRAEGYRALRLPVDIEAILMLRDGARPIDLVDISQSGAGFIFEDILKPGAELDLLLPGGELRREALVRWSRGRRGGLWFKRPLGRGDLESIARFSLESGSDRP